MSYEEFNDNYNIKSKKYYECISDLITHDKVLEMNNYMQHGKTTVLDHCIRVSYSSYVVARLLHLNYKSLARAALLHDFYLYDWHNVNLNENNFFEKHGFVHPEIALANSKKYFEINKIEEDIITKHMWPLTITKPPKYKESFIVTIMDKISALNETIDPNLKRVARILLIFCGIRI